MAPRRGFKHRRHYPRCSVCGHRTLKRTQWKRPDVKCHACQPWRHKRYSSEVYGKLREQARRYRILLHVLGWPDTDEGFKEMLAEIRGSYLCFRDKPESRLAKIDLTVERRNERARLRKQPAPN